MRQTVDKYINNVGDRKIKLILQTMMSYVYSIRGDVDKHYAELSNPIDTKALVDGVESKIASKLNEINNFVNEKLKPYISRIDALELLLRQRDNSLLFDKIDALERFVSSINNTEVTEIIDRVGKLEGVVSNIVIKNDVSETKEVKKTKEKKPKATKKSLGSAFKSRKK